GNPVARTPHLDALAARGTRFAQAYSQHSACAQSRISMQTGWYPHVAGHRTLDHLLQPWEPNVFKTLRAAGYYVAWAGIRGDTFAPGVTAESTDFFGYTVRPSLDAIAASHREAFPPGHRLRHAHYVGCLEDAGLDFDEAAVQTAIQLLGDGLPEPFVLVLTLFAPHPPFAVAEPWFSLHARSDMPAPVAGDGKAAFVAALRERGELDRLERADWAEISATYYGMVSRVDDQLGRVLEALDRAGAAERTVTCSFTDHGEYLGDYGIVEKWPSGLDDCLLRNPLVIAGPNVGEGVTSAALVEMIDLVPTWCELAETDVGHPQFGQSLVSLLTGEAADHRAAVFSEGGFRLDEESQNELRADYPYDLKTGLLHDEPHLVGRAVAIRTNAFAYVYRREEADELYDRVADPAETRNLAGDAAHAATVAELRDQVLRWFVETSDVIPQARDPRMEPALVQQFLPGA
ncbi:MAG TPA: sulfatase-like hydrolase/transferase, partial [Acidimicrobiia bacterium]|nr:sulfatase-like hydrolase/transferase [Acidimicrobiia bacterium]